MLILVVVKGKPKSLEVQYPRELYTNLVTSLPKSKIISLRVLLLILVVSKGYYEYLETQCPRGLCTSSMTS